MGRQQQGGPPRQQNLVARQAANFYDVNDGRGKYRIDDRTREFDVTEMAGTRSGVLVTGRAFSTGHVYGPEPNVVHTAGDGFAQRRERYERVDTGHGQFFDFFRREHVELHTDGLERVHVVKIMVKHFSDTSNKTPKAYP